MTRKCKCSGACGPQAGDVTRREFIEIVGTAAAGAALGTAAWAGQAPPRQTGEDLQQWKRALLQPAPARVYRSAVHGDARMHLGGIGTGNFEIGADGQFTTWQLFNTLRDGYVPLHFLASAAATTKLLQTKGGPDWPRVKEIEMTGEYPLAVLRFRDAELPVEVELTAFSPFAPLDTPMSSLPLAAFVFRLHNPTGENQDASVTALMPNPVGYDASGELHGIAHPSLGGNVSEAFQHAGAAGVTMRAIAGREPAIDSPVAIYTKANLGGLTSPPLDRPKELHIEVVEHGFSSMEKAAGAAHTVIWLEDAPADLAAAWLNAARDAVAAGAMLLFAGKNMPLLKTFAQTTGGKPIAQVSARPDILFEDFEQGYEKWEVEGRAFGSAPAHGTLPQQSAVTGFRGKGLVNSFLGGDDATGRLVSKPFTIQRHFIRFLVGGGSRANTQVRLVVGGKTVRTAAGRDEEQLLPAFWDVREFQGQTAHVEIVDQEKGPWGHINVDHIEFSDRASSPAMLELLDEMLPARFSDVRVQPSGGQGDANTVELAGLELKPEAKRSALGNGLRLLTRPLGKGQVVVACGAILDPGAAGNSAARQRAYGLLCELLGVKYTASQGISSKAPGFGTLVLAALAEHVSVQPALAEDGKGSFKSPPDAKSRGAAPEQAKTPTPSGRTINGAVTASVTLAPGQTVEIPFLLCWHYPNKYNQAGVPIGCHYATLWPDATAVMREAVDKFAGLREKTEKFHKTLYDSTLPYWLLDCLSSQAAIIRHIGVVFRIANGDIFGWEGSNGCCGPTCTHVWGYEQTLARLFPDLEKEMRRIDFKHQQNKNGGVNNRTDVPSPPHPTGEGPFIDGHASCVLKAYREALNSADDSFFKEYWPHVRLAVEFLVGRDAAGAKGKPQGVLCDNQPNTYDQDLHGVTTFISGYYLAALRAGEEWARRVDDIPTADRFHAIFLKGQQNLLDLCWNGEYFQQKLDDYLKRPGEIGPGCMADQLIGQWWAHQLGLGYLLPKQRVQAAMRSIFKYNWVPDMTGVKQMPRAFAGAKDKGLLVCAWPKGGRPTHVMNYSDEVWTGIEYQVAAHMIYEGMIEEAFAVVKGARDRYDGVPRPPMPRNPWNEIECGGHYARAMASWSLLLAASGYEYDGPARILRFAPRVTPERFKAFFCGPEGWGSLRQDRNARAQHNEIAVVDGQLAVTQLRLAGAAPPQKVTVTLHGAALPAKFQATGDEVLVTLASPAIIKSGETLQVDLS